MKHRIDPLILDRAPWLRRQDWATNCARRALYKALSYDKTLNVAQTIADKSAPDIMATMGDMLAQNLSLQGLHNLPRQGAALIVANHPTGIADGIILHHAIASYRPDAYFFANHDVLKVLPQMAPMIAPVEWRAERRSRDTARSTMEFVRQAVDDERLGVIFPSGRLAKRRGLRLFERPWMASAASLARKYNLPIIPVHLRARNSALFYLLDLIHPSVRDITLFHETLNKARQPFAVTIGEPLAARALPGNSDDAIKMLRRTTLSLGLPSDGQSVSLVRATRKLSFKI